LRCFKAPLDLSCTPFSRHSVRCVLENVIVVELCKAQLTELLASRHLVVDKHTGYHCGSGLSAPVGYKIVQQSLGWEFGDVESLLE
jgi:hypothetical protein